MRGEQGAPSCGIACGRVRMHGCVLFTIYLFTAQQRPMTQSHGLEEFYSFPMHEKWGTVNNTSSGKVAVAAMIRAMTRPIGVTHGNTMAQLHPKMGSAMEW